MVLAQKVIFLTKTDAINKYTVCQHKYRYITLYLYRASPGVTGIHICRQNCDKRCDRCDRCGRCDLFLVLPRSQRLTAATPPPLTLEPLALDLTVFIYNCVHVHYKPLPLPPHRIARLSSQGDMISVQSGGCRQLVYLRL